MLAHLRAEAADTAPLSVRIGPPATFAPRSPVLYLEVHGGGAQLAALQRRLGRGPLAPPPSRPERPFVPHVTVAGSVGCERAAAAIELLGAYELQLTLDRLHLLEQDPAAPRQPWMVLVEVPLGGAFVVGRGGRELELSVAGSLSPDEQAWFDTEWSAYAEAQWGPGFRPDEPVAVVARSRPPGAGPVGRGSVVGVAVGSLRPDTLALARVVVARGERRSGVGTALMRAVEDLAARSGCERVRLETARDGPAEAFYRTLGFERCAELPSWRAGRDFVVLVRRLVP